MNGQPLLSVKGLRLGYSRSEVVAGIDLDIPEGSIVSLVGSNGAGKTTTLLGISGILRARGGSIVFGGRELAGLAAFQIARCGVVQVPEGREIFADMTVAENLAMGGLGVSRKVRGRRKDAVLDRFPRLRERLTQLGGLLSGGEQQMLAMGRALMAAPKILLLDEPSMGLAPLIVEQIFQTIAELRREGMTILLVEQNAKAALSIADYAYVMDSGKIALHGEAKSVASNPEIIAAYLGGAT